MTALTPGSATHTSAHGNGVAGPGGRVFNFSAGPSVLPDEVIRQIQEDVWNYKGSGVGILEHSHRGKVYEACLADAEEAVRKVGSVPAGYKVLFLTGGATGQSYLVPANLVPKGGHADFLVTGYWSEKNFEDGKFYGPMHAAANTADRKHALIPDDQELRYSSGPAYVHMTSNNTIYGTQWHRVPRVPAGVPLVCDASSDIYSRPIDVSQYGLIYAGAQKNLGTTGATVVIVREDLVERGSKDIPRMQQLRTYAKESSMPNTPPHFAIYTVGLVARWILSQGGLGVLAQRNEEKAKVLYDAIDRHGGFYIGHARRQDRSLMNVTFRCRTPELDEKFCKEATAAGLDTLKGHRSVGGMRASIYNAFPRAGCVALAQFMDEFARRNG